jgi:hypothetical protein
LDRGRDDVLHEFKALLEIDLITLRFESRDCSSTRAKLSATASLCPQ